MKKRQPAKAPPDASPHRDQIALSYTVFVADAGGRPVPAAPDRVPTNGERIRVLIEANADGYLYVFNQEGDGVVRLLFPDLRIRRGSAKIRAQIPVELPGASRSGKADWFILSGSAPDERLIIVLSRVAMWGWPQGRGLLDYPSGYRVNGQEFERMTGVSGSGAKLRSHHRDGQRSIEDEKSGVDRGPKVSREEPSSPVALMAPQASIVVVYIELGKTQSDGKP